MEIFRLFGTIFLKDNEVDTRLDKIDKKAKGVANTFEVMGEKLQAIGSGLSTFVTLPIIGLGVASFKMASDMAESINKVDTVFKNNSKVVKDWSDTSLEKMGMAQSTALEMASLFGDMGSGMGLNAQDTLKYSTSLTQLAGDLASFKNVQVDVAKTALAGIYTGETESLKQLGIVMTEANLQEYAHSQGIKKKVQEMTQAEKVQLRYNYVMAKTTNAQGDFEKTNKSSSNQVKIFTQSIIQLGTKIGDQLIPIFTPLLQKANDLIKKFSGMDDKSKKLIVTTGLVAAVVGPVVFVLGKLSTGVSVLIKTYQWLTLEKVKQAALWVAEKIKILANIAVLIAQNAVLLTLNGILVIATAAQWAFNVALNANPIGIVVLLIVGLVAVIVLLWKKNEGFRNALISAWNAIKTTAVSLFGGIASFLKTTWDNIKEKATSAWNGIKAFFTAWWNGLKTSFVSFAMGIVNGIIEKWNYLKSRATSIWNGIKSVMLNPIESAKNSIKSIIETIKEWFTNLRLPGFKLPKIKLPHFSLKGEFSLAPPRVPKLDIDWYAKGTDYAPGGLAVVGEQGPELLNLPRGSKVTPNNKMGTELTDVFTGALDELMQNIAGTNRELVLQVDGVKLARILMPAMVSEKSRLGIKSI